jgi:hypothetical protein
MAHIRVSQNQEASKMMNQGPFGVLASLSLAFAFVAASGCSAADPQSAGEDEAVSESQADLTVKRLCGGRLGLTCPKGQFCDAAAPGKCPSRVQYGVCNPRPDLCLEIYKPVCGCNGVTYSNSCFAAAAGVAVASQGKCAASGGTFCGGIAGIQCPDGQVCIDDPSDSCDPNHGGADCGGICVDQTVKPCGNTICPTGTTCCNPLTSTCTRPGMVCAF